MQIAVGEHVVGGFSPGKLREVRGLGADGAELVFGPHAHERHALWSADGPTSVRQAVADAGLVVASVFAGYFHEHPLTHPDSTARRRHALVLERLLDACAAVGTPTLVIPLAPGATDAPLTHLAESLLPLAEKSSGRRVGIAFEVITPSARVPSLRQAMPPALPSRIAYDLGSSAALGGDAVVELELLGDALAQVRVRDATPEGRRPVGCGAVDWAAVRRHLQARQYGGWWVLESQSGSDAPGAAREAITYLRGLAA
jgi:sugar phosphate isomerase/epimerase